MTPIPFDCFQKVIILKMRLWIGLETIGSKYLFCGIVKFITPRVSTIFVLLIVFIAVCVQQASFYMCLFDSVTFL